MVSTDKRVARNMVRALRLPTVLVIASLLSATAGAAGLRCEQLLHAGVAGLKVLAASEVVGSLPAADNVNGRGADANKVSPYLLNLPPFCRVSAILNPVPESRIEIELWLPQQWNGKLLGIGSHGFGGNFERGDMAMGLHRGYAVVTSDLGHSNKTQERQAGFNVGSAEFAVGTDVTVDDFAWRATHEMTVAAKKLVKLHYGAGPGRSYFDGCSNGGRQSMREAQQFPGDYDGIVAGSAATNWTRSMASTVVQFQSGILPSGERMTLPKLRLAHDAAIAACDRLDGLADGLIVDPTRCTWKPQALLCKAGADPGSCLTADEIAAVERVESPLRDPVSGKELYVGMPPGSEIFWRNMLSTNAVTNNNYRYLVVHDPKWQPGAETNVIDLIEKSEQPGSPGNRINSMNPDLSAFRKRGGKLIQYHGWNDPSFAPADTPRYYAEVVDLQSGPDRLQRAQGFYRLFMVPGMAHCYGGEGPINFGGLDHASSAAIDAQHDVLAALDLWVEKGVAPDSIIATQVADDKQPQRQMPLCPWPKVAAYLGGDANNASSFVCRAK
jgi:feruloyl esterase